MTANGTCEKCNSYHSNDANDASPCGKHDACGKNEKFQYTGSSSGDKCVACPKGKKIEDTRHFKQKCKGRGQAGGGGAEREGFHGFVAAFAPL